MQNKCNKMKTCTLFTWRLLYSTGHMGLRVFLTSVWFIMSNIWNQFLETLAGWLWGNVDLVWWSRISQQIWAGLVWNSDFSSSSLFTLGFKMQKTKLFHELIYMYGLFQLLRLAGQSHLWLAKERRTRRIDDVFSCYVLVGEICGQMRPRPPWQVVWVIGSQCVLCIVALAF